MRILVTGGAGYIGSHAVKALLEAGQTVEVIDNLATGNRDMVDTRATFHEIDIHDTAEVATIMKNGSIDAVMHFAAFSLVGESGVNPLKYYRNNVEGTRSLLAAMVKAGVNTLVFSSTAAVYGEPDTVPIVETHALAPTNTYGETKRAVEAMLKNVADAHEQFNYVSLRYFNVAGAHHSAQIGEKHDPETHLIPNVLKSVIREEDTLKVFGDDYPTHDGSAVRDYIHVEDLVDAHIKALHHVSETQQSEIFNLGSAQGYSVLEILKKTGEVTGKPVPYTVAPRRKGDPATLVASHQKAHEILGWKPRRTLQTIIESAYRFHKKEWSM